MFRNFVSYVHFDHNSNKLYRVCRRFNNNDSKRAQVGPLHGIRVIEVGNFIAGPLCATLLGYYGAEVIKIEPPGYFFLSVTLIFPHLYLGGDQIRSFRDADPTGTGWWWRSLGRNKKCVVMDLKNEESQKLVLKLCKTADVFVENFKPGKIDEWNLGYKTISSVNPNIVYSSVSGYGQTGPYKSRPGFASVCEAMGGFRYVNGYPDRPSVRPNLSIGDTLAGMQAAFGTVLALLAKERLKGIGGQQVDTAIYESVFQLMEGTLCDYSGTGVVREMSGSTITGIVPTGTYKTKDNKEIVIGANSDTLFKKLMIVINQPELSTSVLYDSNSKRVEHQAFIDNAISGYISTINSDVCLEKMKAAGIPHGLIYSIKDIVNDPQYQDRGMIETVYVEELDRTLQVPAMGTKLVKTPGKTTWAGPRIGKHSKEVYEDILKLDKSEISRLVEVGSIFLPEDYEFGK